MRIDERVTSSWQAGRWKSKRRRGPASIFRSGGCTAPAAPVGLRRGFRPCRGARPGVPGGARAGLNLPAEQAVIFYLPGTTTLTELRRAIQDSGYTPLEIAVSEPGADREKAVREREAAELKRKFLMGALLSTLIVIGALPHMGLHAD